MAEPALVTPHPMAAAESATPSIDVVTEAVTETIEAKEKETTETIATKVEEVKTAVTEEVKEEAATDAQGATTSTSPTAETPRRKRAWRRLFEAVIAKLRRTKKTAASAETSPGPSTEASASEPIKQTDEKQEMEAKEEESTEKEVAVETTTTTEEHKKQEETSAPEQKVETSPAPQTSARPASAAAEKTE